MAFNMKRPVIKGSVLHKASVKNSEERQAVESNADLISAAGNLGRSRGVQGVDYSIDGKDVKFGKKENKKDSNKNSLRNKCVGPGCKADETEIIDNWSQGENDPDEIDPDYFDSDDESNNTGVVDDNSEYRSMPVEPPPNPNDLRKAQRPISLAPKNFKLKPINIDSQELKIKKASRNFDYKPTIGKEEMEVIKKAEEDRRRANDPLLAEINDRRELKKAGPDNVDPLTREILDQSDMPKPVYGPEYRKTYKASKIDGIDAQLLPSNPDLKPEKADMPSQKKTKLAHENPKYALKKGVEGKSLNLNSEKGYKLTTENGESFITYNGVPITTNEVPNEIMLDALREQKKQQKNIDLNSNTPSQSPAQKRDDSIWKRAVKDGKAQQNMRKSGYIPPEER